MRRIEYVMEKGLNEKEKGASFGGKMNEFLTTYPVQTAEVYHT
jgi:hypothetical protein